VGSSSFFYHMMYDHDIVGGNFGDLRVLDCTNYPKTQIPEGAPREPTTQREIIGVREAGQSTLSFECTIYSEECPLHKPRTLLAVKVDVA